VSDPPRVLVCEDAVGYRILIARWLEDAGMEVVAEADSWVEAERRAAELQPDVVVADLWMPELDTDALVRVRAGAPEALVVSLSGLAVTDQPPLLEGTQARVDLFLSKRQPPADIVEALRALVSERRSA
jgi:DNA-binding NarL/FixJ family response regulator